MLEAKHTTADVFGVSRDLPITYVERDDVDDKLLDNLTRDRHVIIYGSSKQGKTCLRRHCLQDNDSIQCQNIWDIGKLNEAILKAAGESQYLVNTASPAGAKKTDSSFITAILLGGLFRWTLTHGPMTICRA